MLSINALWVAAALISAMALPQAQAEEMKEPNQILITMQAGRHNYCRR
jgi:hypothetical protein